jgi:hypothetical protein
VAVVLVSGSVGSYFYFNAIGSLIQSLRSRLQNSAALLSQSIDARELDVIRTPADMHREAYQRTLRNLRRLRRANPDIAFLYVMRRETDNQVTFVVDSDETEKQALPGRDYPDAPDRLLAQVEQFVEAHTGACFTHKLCPECVIKLYGDILSEEQ